MLIQGSVRTAPISRTKDVTLLPRQFETSMTSCSVAPCDTTTKKYESNIGWIVAAILLPIQQERPTKSVSIPSKIRSGGVWRRKLLT